MKWLKFGCKFPSKWLSFQSQSTRCPIESICQPVFLSLSNSFESRDFSQGSGYFLSPTVVIVARSHPPDTPEKILRLKLFRPLYANEAVFSRLSDYDLLVDR